MIQNKKNFGAKRPRIGEKDNSQSVKRFSKAKMKHDAVQEANAQSEVKVIKKKATPEERKVYYQSRAAETTTLTFLTNKVTREYSGILIKTTEQHKGFAQLGKGQCVWVKEFGDTPLVSVKANDGRMGIIAKTFVKPISSLCV